MSGTEDGYFVVFSAQEVGRMAIDRALAERGLPASTPCAAVLDFSASGTVTMTVEIGAGDGPEPAAPASAAEAEAETIPAAVIAGMTL